MSLLGKISNTIQFQKSLPIKPTTSETGIIVKKKPTSNEEVLFKTIDKFILESIKYNNYISSSSESTTSYGVVAIDQMSHDVTGEDTMVIGVDISKMTFETGSMWSKPHQQTIHTSQPEVDASIASTINNTLTMKTTVDTPSVYAISRKLNQESMVDDSPYTLETSTSKSIGIHIKTAIEVKDYTDEFVYDITPDVPNTYIPIPQVTSGVVSIKLNIPVNRYFSVVLVGGDISGVQNLPSMCKFSYQSSMIYGYYTQPTSSTISLLSNTGGIYTVTIDPYIIQRVI